MTGLVPLKEEKYQRLLSLPCEVTVGRGPHPEQNLLDLDLELLSPPSCEKLVSVTVATQSMALRYGSPG